jgi:hypothetical protein
MIKTVENYLEAIGMPQERSCRIDKQRLKASINADLIAARSELD